MQRNNSIYRKQDGIAAYMNTGTGIKSVLNDTPGVDDSALRGISAKRSVITFVTFRVCVGGSTGAPVFLIGTPADVLLSQPVFNFETCKK